jgi:hypothetical protein
MIGAVWFLFWGQLGVALNFRTLRGMIRVPRIYRGSQIGNATFWPRFKRLPHPWGQNTIFVDGFVGCCHSNSCGVFTDALEAGITLWLRYACAWDNWYEHAWCMLGDRIIETTFGHAIYFVAELTTEELAEFAKRHSEHKQELRKNLRVATFVNGERAYVEYDAAIYADSIGRERDPFTRDIQQRLGRGLFGQK